MGFRRVGILVAILALIAGMILALPSGSTAQAAMVTVSSAAELHDALTGVTASPGDTIELAPGVYVPTEMTDPPDLRSAAFEVTVQDLTLVGAGAGLTVLSGELQGDADPSNNAYHVMSIVGVAGRLSLSDLTIQDGFADSLFSDEADPDNKGPAILSVGVDLTLDSVEVKDNFSTRHGAIRMDSGDLVVSDSVFTDNVTTGIGGGALRLNMVTATISGSTFLRNTSGVGGPSYGGGGAIRLANLFALPPTRPDGIHVVIEDSVFEENTSTAFGGAVVVFSSGKSSARITNNQFVRNESAMGGGVYVDGMEQALLQGNTYIENTATQAGGAVFGAAYFSDPLLPFRVIFGPPIGQETILRDEQFSGNTALGLISAEYKTSFLPLAVAIPDSFVKGGGAVANAQNSRMIIEDSMFEENIAVGGDGGAVVNGGGAVRQFNFIPPFGLFDFVGGGELVIDDSKFEKNEAPGGNAGAIASISNSVGFPVLGTRPLSLVVTDSKLDENEAAGDGGGIYVVEGTDFALDESSLKNNSAGGDGGGVWNDGDADITGSRITDNDAGGLGGGIANFGTLTLVDSKVANNDPDDILEAGP